MRYKTSLHWRQLAATLVCLFGIKSGILLAHELTGTGWQLIEIAYSDDQVFRPENPSHYTLHFHENNHVALRIDCNRAKGTWKSEGPSHLEFGPLAVTMAYCGPESLHDRLLKDLPLICSYVLKDGRLLLSLKADKGIYQFAPVPAFPSLELGPRRVPVPQGLSAELSELVTRPVPPLQQMPETNEAWQSYQKELDEAAAQRVEAMAQALDVQIEAREIAGVSTFVVTPGQAASSAPDRIGLIHVHGGAFVQNAGLAGAGEAVILAAAMGQRVLSVDYGMPPQRPFPTAIDDVFAVWQSVRAEHGAQDGTLAMAGSSTGANIIMRVVQRCIAEGQALPRALFLGAPIAHLDQSGDSLFLHAELDRQLGRYEGRLESSFRLYAGERSLSDPELSPLYGSMQGFPPTIIISGTRDLYLSSAVRTHRALRQAGVRAELHIFEGFSHGDYLNAYPAPEALEALTEVARFLAKDGQ